MEVFDKSLFLMYMGSTAMCVMGHKNNVSKGGKDRIPVIRRICHMIFPASCLKTH